jgi:hypothetical protein
MAANRLDQLIDAFEPILRRAFLESIFNIRDRAQLDQIVRMLEARDVDGAVRAVGLDPASFRPFDKAIGQAFEAGGDFTAKALPAIRDASGFVATFQFGIRNPAAERFLSDHSSTMVRDIVDDQRNMVRGFLTHGLARGDNPRTSALDLVGRINTATKRREGGVIGLTSSQEGWTRRYAVELENNDPAALTRGLRDRRFDRTVSKAIASNQPIPAVMRAKMVRNMRNNALRYRAETIARSETLKSLHAAQEQALDQAIASGLDGGAIREIWRTARDKRVRDTHQSMEGQTVRRGGMFVTGSGAHLRFPGDPSGPASEIIQCRCWREILVDHLANVR